MPGSGDVAPSSQGSTVSFAGQSIGMLLAIRATGSSVSGTDVTTMSSTVAGTGSAAHVKRELDVMMVDPGQVSITFFGVGPTAEVGDRGELSVSIAGSTVLSGDAFLSSYDVEAGVGELVKGSATFQLTGA